MMRRAYRIQHELLSVLLLIGLIGKTENKEQIQDHVESLAKDFFRNEGIYSISVHVQERKWNPLIRKMFSRGDNYIEARDKASEIRYLPSNNRVGQLFLEDDIDRLNQLLLKSVAYNKSLWPKRNISSASENVWLIHNKQRLLKNDLKQISHIFHQSPLSMDALVFTFTEQGQDDVVCKNRATWCEAANPDCSRKFVSNQCKKYCNLCDKFGSYIIHEIYKINKNSNSVEVHEYGNWNPIDGLTVTEVDIWKRRANLKGHHLKVVSAITAPYTTHVEDGCTTKDCFKGLYADVFHELAQIINFTFTISLVESYGSKFDNGSWNGMIGKLVDGNSDFAAAAFSQSKARSMVVDYISLNLEEYQQIFIRNPAELYHWEVYSLPLTKNAWFGVLVFLVITPFLMSVATMEVRILKSARVLMSENVNIVYRSLLMLGCDTVPDSFRSRIVFIVVLIMGMVLYWLWEAMLISYFSSANIILEFNNLEELLSKSKTKIVLPKGYIAEDFFRYSADPTVQKVWKKRIEPYMEHENYPSSEAELQDFVMENPSFALFGDALSQKSTYGYKTCKFIELPKRKYGNYPSGFTIPKNSPFKPIFQYYVKRMLENGNVVQIKTIYEKSYGEQICESYEGKPVGLNKSFSLFAMYIGAAILSLLVLMLECLLIKVLSK